MPDRLLFPLMGLAAVLMIGLALVWPQGLGARSPWPFGHPPMQQSPPAARAAPAGAPQTAPALLGLSPSPSTARPVR